MIKNTSIFDMLSNFKQVSFKMPLDNRFFSGVFLVSFGLGFWSDWIFRYFSFKV